MLEASAGWASPSAFLTWITHTISLIPGQVQACKTQWKTKGWVLDLQDLGISRTPLFQPQQQPAIALQSWWVWHLWSHGLGPSPADQNLRFGKSLWHTDPMSLRDLCFLRQKAFEIDGDSGAPTLNYSILLVCRESARGTGVHRKPAFFSLNTGHLPTWSCEKEPEVQWRERVHSGWSRNQTWLMC